MINVENVAVLGWEHAIRGMRNPMNSWDKSDSEFNVECNICDNEHYNRDDCSTSLFSANGCDNTLIGPKDLNLMMRLAKGGAVEAKYRRMIVVYADITAPLYWWSEFDTYKVGTVANSCSKMHKLLSKPFEMNDFSFDKLPGYKKEIKYFIPEVDKKKEEWKPTIEDKYYMVSNEGRISHDGRILSGSIHKDGYIFVDIRGKSYAKHRVVAKAFIPNPDNKPFINHIDGNKQNNKIENLEWCTQSENIKHEVKYNLQPSGLSTYKGKFTPEQREEIKHFWDSGEYSRREIALMYGVSHTCINDIINDKYKYAEKTNVFEEVARPIIDILNELRDSYFICEDETDKKHIWYSIVQLLPSSYNQKRTVMLNYEVLSNIYKSRKNHKLDEWREFCKFIETLPYSELITLKV